MPMNCFKIWDSCDVRSRIPFMPLFSCFAVILVCLIRLFCGLLPPLPYQGIQIRHSACKECRTPTQRVHTCVHYRLESMQSTCVNCRFAYVWTCVPQTLRGSWRLHRDNYSSYLWAFTDYSGSLLPQRGFCVSFYRPQLRWPMRVYLPHAHSDELCDCRSTLRISAHDLPSVGHNFAYVPLQAVHSTGSAYNKHHRRLGTVRPHRLFGLVRTWLHFSPLFT